MSNLFSKNSWLTGALIFLMPVILVIFLGSQMAYSQVSGGFEAYQSIPEVTSLAQLEALPAAEIIILRGHISEASAPADGRQAAAKLLIFQERPTDGREVRYREEFPLIFPDFVMDLSDGSIAIEPSLTRDKVIQNELHTVAAGDRVHTGFQTGDLVSVQGQWQPNLSSTPALVDVTGITSVDKQTLIADWEADFQKVGWARNILGLVSLVSIILLVVQLRRTRTDREGSKKWKSQETTTAPTTSP